LAAILAIPVSACVTASDETALDGWGNYKIGMTTDEVLAIPGVLLSQPELGEFLGTRFTVRRALETVSFDGRKYSLLLYFPLLSQQMARLGWIELVDERGSVPLLQCEADFQNTLAVWRSDTAHCYPRLTTSLRMLASLWKKPKACPTRPRSTH